MRVKFLITLVGLFLLTGCSSHMLDLRYEETAQINSSSDLPMMAVGGVTDSRGTASNWLGAIRGGYGNPLKKIYSTEPTSKAVAGSLEEALRRRQLLASLEEAILRIDVEIKKFDTSYYFNKEAHADLAVEVFSQKTGNLVYRESYRVDNEKAGAGAGIFGNAEALGEFANLTLNQALDSFLDDPKFATAVMNRPTDQEESTTTSRLDELKGLLEKGLITEQEYERERARVLNEI